ncbi:MAG TPA: hypothetical protein VIJ70_00360 [Gaiellaceae bacterium]
MTSRSGLKTTVSPFSLSSRPTYEWFALDLEYAGNHVPSGLDSLHGCDPINGAIERCDLADAAYLGGCNEVCLGEIEPVDLVELEGAEQQRLIGHHDRRETDDRADELRDPAAVDLVERLEEADRLGDDQIGKEQFIRRCEKCARAAGLGRGMAQIDTLRAIAADEGVRVKVASPVAFLLESDD